MAHTLFQTKTWKSINNFPFTSHPILPLVLGRTSKHATFPFYLMLNASLKSFFFLMPGFFFLLDASQLPFLYLPACWCSLCSCFIFIHMHTYMYVHNLSPLGFSLAITILLWFCFFKKNKSVKYLAALSREIKKVILVSLGKVCTFIADLA